MPLPVSQPHWSCSLLPCRTRWAGTGSRVLCETPDSPAWTAADWTPALSTRETDGHFICSGAPTGWEIIIVRRVTQTGVDWDAGPCFLSHRFSDVIRERRAFGLADPWGGGAVFKADWLRGEQSRGNKCACQQKFIYPQPQWASGRVWLLIWGEIIQHSCHFSESFSILLAVIKCKQPGHTHSSQQARESVSLIE